MPKLFTLDIAHIERRIVANANRGGQRAAQYALERVRKHAPVRKLFHGTTYAIKTFGANKFRVARIRKVQPSNGLLGTISGHANTEIPLFRIRQGGRTAGYLSGDFRAVDPTTRRLRKVNMGVRYNEQGNLALKAPGQQTTPAELTLLSRTNAGRYKHAAIEPISGEKIRTGGGKRLMTSRGKYEVRSGRADYQAPGSSIVRVGGRLKGELHIQGPEEKGAITWWFIVSATKDPETGRLYPRDQEFGTSHNRPHPFLRPGLHESRGPFRRFVREAIRGGLRA